ncbi:MAG: MATE family efflux transporter [Bacilli bacterium]
MLNKLLGSKKFYKRIVAISLPIMLHQGITNFVNLLDNIMVGQLDKNAIAGVAIAAQLLFIVNIALMGGLAGPGIFVAQYNGAKDDEGVRQSFRAKVLFAIIISIPLILIYSFFSPSIIHLFLDEAASIQAAQSYLNIMIVGIVLIAIVQLYGSSLREIGKTHLPLIAGVIAICINLFLNYVLIFGHFGFPALGVRGAAIATVFSRVIEVLILVIMSHARKEVFCHGAYKNFKIDKRLLGRIFKKGMPLLANEVLWSLGSTVTVLAYSMHGEDIVSALTISQATTNMFFILFGALGNSIAIIVGSDLGANKLEEAKANAHKLIAFGTAIAILMGVILIVISRYIPLLYNVDDSIRHIAQYLMTISGIFFAVYTYNVCCFFTLRAGGATRQTLIFDSLFMWLGQVTIALLLTLFTEFKIYEVFIAVQLTDVIKSFIGTSMVRKGIWIKNLALKLD